MKCIFCGNQESKVVDSRYLKDTSIRRRRECLGCGKRFTTYETVESNPMVVTNVDNMREPFKREKLLEQIKKILSEREFTILCLRYALKGGIPLPQREVANVLKISRSYISRIEKHAVEKLRMRPRSEDFLD